MYDISKRESFLNLDKWMNELKEHADRSIQIMLVGNKQDLEQKRKVSTQEAQIFAND